MNNRMCRYYETKVYFVCTAVGQKIQMRMDTRFVGIKNVNTRFLTTTGESYWLKVLEKMNPFYSFAPVL